MAQGNLSIIKMSHSASAIAKWCGMCGGNGAYAFSQMEKNAENNADGICIEFISQLFASRQWSDRGGMAQWGE